ncbi:hypothetical protein NP493_738g00018 [Ridgeia piscesae]|uniref:Uncharacterized protein n=1 Tax=Ridgeia piscesae TaxID=27915 RepID=A0AAD9KPY4_RIDPI|nr:hypothetical protein NP493_738g00018 [Ridgeia piscesae]
MFVTILLGYPFRTLLGAQQVGPLVRHCIEIAGGLLLTYFCFGLQIWHIFAQSLLCYLLMKNVRPGKMQLLVFVASLGYLCVGHVYRLIYDYGGYTLDITGPLMINTQRLSSLAFSLADGQAKDESKLSPTTKQQAVKKFPSVLEFLSYVFSFHTIICGPFSFYQDYIHFIEGTDVSLSSQTHSVSNGKSTPTKTPSHTPAGVVWRKLLECVFCGFFTVVILPKFPITHLRDNQYKQAHFLYRMLYVILCTSVTRQRYYLAWKLAEAGNISSGFGFNGCDSSGKSKWDLLDNAHVLKVEFASNLKVLLDNWNIRTSHWLRHVVYERVHSTLAVFVFSAFWHGFYGGYYISFMTAALFISAGRHVRRNIRPFFQSSAILSTLYDVITVVGTQIMLAYLTFPFVLLEFWLSLEILWGMFFWLHVVTIGVVILFTFVKLHAPKADEKKVK